MTGDEERELQLWRQVFGPATLAQLEHLAGSVHCNCNPVCGHEEEYCAEYDALDTSVAARMGDEAARRALQEGGG